jgi:hypothetical protein
MWQDVVLSGGGFILALAATLSFVHGTHVPLRTAGLYMVVLTSFTVAFATLDLWLATSSGIAQTLAWSALGLRSLRGRRRSRGQGSPVP